jgi:hypothetical protein
MWRSSTLGADDREPYGLPVQGRDQPKAEHKTSQGALAFRLEEDQALLPFAPTGHPCG